ncbi:MAG TPA: ABC transporter permease [Bryobacteraceae bacterium]
MIALGQDLRYCLRVYRKAPGFTAVAVLALTFGIGVNSAIFTVLNSIALRPLPVRNANEVVSVYQELRGTRDRNVHGAQSYLSFAEYQAYRDQNHSLSGLAAYAIAELSLGGEKARAVNGFLVTCNYFGVLSGPLALGRGFAESECAADGASPVVVLSHKLWQNQFGGDPAILGRKIVLNRSPFTVVGVAAQGFSGASLLPADVWAPISMTDYWMGGRKGMLRDANLSWLETAGRLKPGSSVAAARADLAVIAARMDQQNPGRTTIPIVNVASMMNLPEGRVAVLAVGAVILAAVSLVLLIACANLANLLLARAAARQKEIAVRLAIGASRARLIGQMLTESVMLALAGGALGLLMAWWTLRSVFPLILSRLPQEMSSISLNLSPDPRILLYSLLVALGTGIAFGLLPALQSSRVDLNSALKETTSGFGHSRGRLRGALVITQIAVCLVLLIAAGLLARGLQAAQNVEPGYNVADVVFAEFDLTRQGYDAPRAAAFHRQLAERLSRYAGIDAVARVEPIPLGASRHGTTVALEGKAGDHQISNSNVSAGYFRLLGIPVIRGRAFDEREERAGAPVAVISETAARNFWPNEDAIGKRFRTAEEQVWREVVGIAKDVRTTGLSDTDGDFVYFPARERSLLGQSVMVHGKTGTAAMAKAILSEAHALDPDILVRTGRLADNLDLWKLPTRVLSILATALGVAGLLLASLGIYGVMAYAVAQRTREIGIRMALGAQQPDVLWLVLRQSLRSVAIGLGLGLAGCAAVSKVLSSLLFRVSPLDPIVFGGVSLFLASVAVVASYLPAIRATRVDPLSALRHQ